MREPDSCRPGCGACCIAPSISSPIPGMPAGKPAGVRCSQLDDDNACRLFGQPQRPAVCASLQPSAAMCGSDRTQAVAWLAQLELLTAPAVATGHAPAIPAAADRPAAVVPPRLRLHP